MRILLILFPISFATVVMPGTPGFAQAVEHCRLRLNAAMVDVSTEQRMSEASSESLVGLASVISDCGLMFQLNVWNILKLMDERAERIRAHQARAAEIHEVLVSTFKDFKAEEDLAKTICGRVPLAMEMEIADLLAITNRYIDIWTKYDNKRFFGGLELSQVKEAIPIELAKLRAELYRSRVHRFHEAVAAQASIKTIQEHIDEFERLTSDMQLPYIVLENQINALWMKLVYAEQSLNRVTFWAAHLAKLS